jgi:hypothetical protein
MPQIQRSSLTLSFDPFHDALKLGPTLLSQWNASSFMPAFDPLLDSIPGQQSIELPAKRRRTAEYAASLDAAKFVINFLEQCDGKVKDIYKSKELWRGPESIYRKEVVLALSGDKQEFELREAASEAFPTEITSSHIRASIAKYEDKMLAASLKSMCYSYGRFVAAPDIYEVDD